MAALLAAGLLLVDPYLSSFVPHGVWQRLRLIDFHHKASVALPLLRMLATWLELEASKAGDKRSLRMGALNTAGVRVHGAAQGPQQPAFGGAGHGRGGLGDEGANRRESSDQHLPGTPAGPE
jgi:hypothetical protein